MTPVEPAKESIPASESIDEAVRQVAAKHFAKSHQLIPEFYRRYFLNPRCVTARHWQHRKDIPGDLIFVPRLIWQSIRRNRNQEKRTGRALTGKEAEVLRVIESELIQPELLQQKIIRAVSSCHPDWQEDWQLCTQRLQRPMQDTQRAAIAQFLAQKTRQLSGPREGSRDLLVFLIIGVIGNQLSSKVTFGSAIATGSALAGSIYLSQQAWWYSLWLSWSGIPTWVSWAGAVGGLVTAVALTPVLSPFAELLVNRLRGERFLHNLLDEVEAESFRKQPDMLDAAGTVAGISQIIPDLIALLKNLKV